MITPPHIQSVLAMIDAVIVLLAQLAAAYGVWLISRIQRDRHARNCFRLSSALFMVAALCSIVSLASR